MQGAMLRFTTNDFYFIAKFLMETTSQQRQEPDVKLQGA